MNNEIRTVATLITAPSVAPMTAAYAKLHVKAISTAEDTLITTWIEAARSYFEAQTGRQIMTAVWELWLDCFPASNAKIELPRPPLQSVTSVQYVDADGTLQDFTDGASPETKLWAEYAPQGEYARRGWIEPASGQSWPTTRTESGAVRIQFVAGYADIVADVPALITGILCYLVGHFDQFRSEVHFSERGGKLEQLPFGMQQLLNGFKYSALSSTLPRSPWTS